MNPSSPKIDFFGTFLDTLSSGPMGQTAPSQAAASSPRAGQTADPAVGGLSDSIILALLSAGNASVPLATLMIELKQPPSSILKEVALLQKFGIVTEAADGGLGLTADGRSVAQTYHDFRQNPKPA